MKGLVMTADSTNSANTALVAIDFHGDQIVTFQKDGEPFVAMRRVVENLGLAWQSQLVKLRDQADRFNCHDIVTVGADGKPREMLAMPVAKLPLWLATINPNKIADPVKRQKVEWYQAESAIVLHDYWTKGVAVRGDMDGLVTNLDPSVMRSLGGMVKGIISKALQETVPALVDAELMKVHGAVARGVTAGEVIKLAGIDNRKGLRGIPRRVSDQLRRFCAERGLVVNIGNLGSSSAYVFDLASVREWLSHGGRDFIHRLVEEKRGQGSLKLVR